MGAVTCSTRKPFVPPAPPGEGRGERDVAELLGPGVGAMQAQTRALEVDRFAAPEEFLDFKGLRAHDRRTGSPTSQDEDTRAIQALNAKLGP